MGLVQLLGDLFEEKEIQYEPLVPDMLECLDRGMSWVGVKVGDCLDRVLPDNPPDFLYRFWDVVAPIGRGMARMDSYFLRNISPRVEKAWKPVEKMMQPYFKKIRDWYIPL